MMKKIRVVLFLVAGVFGTPSRAADVPTFVAQQEALHSPAQEAEWNAYLSTYQQSHEIPEDTYGSVYIAWPSWESDHGKEPDWVRPFVTQLVKDLKEVDKLIVLDSDQAYNDSSLGGPYRAVEKGFKESNVVVILGTPEFNNGSWNHSVADTELGSAISKEKEIKKAGPMNSEIKWCVLHGSVEKSLPMDVLKQRELTISPVLFQGVGYKEIVDSILNWVFIEFPKKRELAWSVFFQKGAAKKNG